MTQLAHYQGLTNCLLGVWAILSGLEWLFNSRLVSNGGILEWPLLRLREGFLFRPSLDWLWSHRIFQVAQVVRVGCGAALILLPVAGLYSSVANSLLIASCLYVNVRICFGNDGSDQMGLMVAIGSLVAQTGVALSDSTLAYAGAVFIGGQAFLAYFVAGAAKAASNSWRNGLAVAGVMNTATFGNAWAAGATRRPTASLIIGWFVILTEVSFPIAFVAPEWLLLTCLVGFAFFHVCNALFMGLNAFVPAFLSTYPTIIFLNLTFHSLFSAG